MSRRNKIILYTVISLVVLLIIVVLIISFNRDRSVDGSIINQSPVAEPRRLPVLPVVNDNAKEFTVQEQSTEVAITAIAKTFAEGFGSFSNQSDFDSLADLSPIMTLKMKSNAEPQIRAELTGVPEGVYYGVSTVGLSVTISEFDDNFGRAKAVVATQRQKSQGTSVNPEVFYQDLVIDLVRTGSGWMVDEASWQ